MLKRCRAEIVALAAVAAAAWLAWLAGDGGRAHVEVVRADFGASALIPIVISLLGNLFQRFNGRTNSETKYAFEGIRSDITNISRRFLDGIVDLAGKVAAVLGATRRVLSTIFGRLYNMLAEVVNRIARILDRIFGPIIDFLDKVRFYLKKIYDKILRPILDTIEIVRSFLQLLALFNVDWARKLDQKLAELEQYVLAPYDWLVGKINTVENWINRIVTLDGLIQRVALIGAMVRDVEYTNKLFFNSQIRSLTPRQLAALQKVDVEDHPELVITKMRRHVARQDTDVSGAIRESIANVKINLRRAA